MILHRSHELIRESDKHYRDITDVLKVRERGIKLAGIGIKLAGRGREG